MAAFPKRLRQRKANDGLHLLRQKEAERVTVDGDEAGQRLDSFLTQRLGWRSRAGMQRLIRERAVTVGGLRRRASYRLQAGDIILIPLPPAPKEAFEIGQIPLNIIYEDEHIVVLNKQAGIAVHPAGRHRFNTLINALSLRYRRPDDPEHDIMPTLAHRLDLDTSGVLLVCKSEEAKRQIAYEFDARRVQKSYLAILEGEPQEDKFTIDLPLGIDEEDELELRQAVRTEGGVHARTDITVLERFGRFSLISADIHTGRQHQIRVHVAHIGCPVLCDWLYGRRRTLTRAELGCGTPPPSELVCGTAASSSLSLRAEGPGCADAHPTPTRANAREPADGAAHDDDVLLARQALHAQRLVIRHPITKVEMTFTAPLPDDMQRLLDCLREMRHNDPEAAE